MRDTVKNSLLRVKKARYFLITVLVIAAGVVGFLFTRNNLGTPTANKLTPTQSPLPTAEPTPNFPKTLGEFLVTDKEICEEEGKPLVYLFGSSSCPHCVWEKPIVKEVTDKFKGEISYHENIDTEKEMEVFQKYMDVNPQGYIPFLIFGCKYVRYGAGESLGETPEESKKLEKEALTAILCKLTEGKPESVCAAVKDKVSQIQ